MTSPLTATTISTATPTLTAATDLPNYPLAAVASAAQVVLAVLVVLAALAASVVQATVRRSYLPAAIRGSITHNIAAARHTPTEPQRLGTVVLHAAIPCPTDRRVHGRTLIRELGNSPRRACRTVALVPVQAPGI
jgi:hypothetical protein